MATEAIEAVETPETTDTTATAETEATPAEQASAAEVAAAAERLRGPDGKFVPKEQKAAPAPEAEKPKADVKYELVLPKDSVLPAATIERTAAIARELGLDNPAAQKVVDSFNAIIAADLDAEATAWKPGVGPAWIARDAEWKADALKDAEIGGTPEKLKASVDKANLVLQKFFDPDVAEFLKATGLGSKKEFIRGLAKIGRAMSEGSLVLGQAADTSGPKRMADIMYPNNGEGPLKKQE